MFVKYKNIIFNKNLLSNITLEKKENEECIIIIELNDNNNNKFKLKYKNLEKATEEFKKLYLLLNN